MPILLLIIITIAIFLGKSLRQKLRLRRWRKALALDKHRAIFEQLYAETDGYALSRQARAAQDAPEYVYGEILFEPFIALLSLCKPSEKTVFYDLGSGTGKAVLACAMVFPVKKSCGVELFANLHRRAQRQEEQLKRLPEYQSLSIELRNENFLETQLNEANLIFINATAFIGEIWNDISEHLEQLSPGALVISTSKPLASEQFIRMRETRVSMSWGVVFAFIQRRRNNTL